MNKKDLRLLANKYNSTSDSLLEKVGRLGRDHESIRKINDFIETLPEDTNLSFRQIEALKKLITPSANKNVEVIFKSIRDEIAREERLLVVIAETSKKFREVFFQYAVKLWRENYFYDRSQSLVNALHEKRLLSTNNKEPATFILTAAYIGLSWYGAYYYRSVAFFAGRLGLAAAQLVPIKFIQSQGLKPYLGCLIGFGISGFDLMGGGGIFVISYLAGVFLELLATIFFKWISATRALKEYARKNPHTIVFLKNTIEDMAFLMGSLLGRIIFISLPSLRTSPSVPATSVSISTSFAEPTPIKTKPTKFSSIHPLCPIPPGSFYETCKDTYARSFPITEFNNGQQYNLCVYEVSCKRFGREDRLDKTFALPISMIDCLSYIENCDGELFFRETDKRLCTDKTSIDRELAHARAEFEQSCTEIKFSGSHGQTCPVQVQSVSSTNKKKYGLSENAYCFFQFTCSNLAQNPVHHYHLMPKFIRNCMGFFENCDGQLVKRNSLTDHACKNATQARISGEHQRQVQNNLTRQFQGFQT